MVAYVGPTEITERQLDDAVAGVTSTLEEGQQVSREAVVNALIHGVLAEQIAAANKITVTDAERDQLLKDSRAGRPARRAGGPAGRLRRGRPADRRREARRPRPTSRRSSEQPVTLNPRFGVLDPAAKLIVAGPVRVARQARVAHSGAEPLTAPASGEVAARLPELERLVAVMSPAAPGLPVGRPADPPVAGAVPDRGDRGDGRGDRDRRPRSSPRGAGRPAAAGDLPRRDRDGRGTAASTSRTWPGGSPTSWSPGTRTCSPRPRCRAICYSTWEQRKAAEKGRTSVLQGIPEQLSALSRANKIISRAGSRRVPVDLPDEPVTAERGGRRSCSAWPPGPRPAGSTPTRRSATRSARWSARWSRPSPRLADPNEEISSPA